MKLKTSNKTASFGRKPWYKKGYYPAKLLKVEPYANRETGELIEGKYGHQLIFEFAVYACDENDTPTTPLMFKEEDKESVAVVIPKFVYHEYKDKKTGEFQTAITPNSAITGTLKALGWVFSEDDVDIDALIGNWVEVNLNDFDTKTKEGKKYVASTIADVGPYKGGEIGEVEEVKPSKAPESVKKQVKHSETELPKEEASSPVAEDNPEVLKKKIEDLNQLHKDGHLTDEGHKQATEQLQTKLDSLNK